MFARKKWKQQDKWYDGMKWRTRLNKRDHTLTLSYTHTADGIGIRWREMGGLSGTQLNAVIRFEIQPYWLERWVWRRRFDRARSRPGGGDNTSALTQTMMDRVAGEGDGEQRRITQASTQTRQVCKRKHKRWKGWASWPGARVRTAPRRNLFTPFRV